MFCLRAAARDDAKRLRLQAATIAEAHHGETSLLAMQCRHSYAAMLLEEGRPSEAHDAAMPVLMGLNPLIRRLQAENLDKYPPPPPQELSVASRHMPASYEQVEGATLLLVAKCFADMGQYKPVGC